MANREEEFGEWVKESMIDAIPSADAKTSSVGNLIKLASMNRMMDPNIAAGISCPKTVKRAAGQKRAIQDRTLQTEAFPVLCSDAVVIFMSQ